MNTIRHLPKEIPLMLARGIVLLPHATLSVPLEDESYFSFFVDVFKKGGYIGIVQPCLSGFLKMPNTHVIVSDELSFFEVGTLGKITDITKTDDGKNYVLMRGISRFRMKKYTTQKHSKFPLASVAYDMYDDDLIESSDRILDRTRFMRVIQPVFEDWEIVPEWDALFGEAHQTLMNNLMMACPMIPEEKQAVLQEKTVFEQSELFLQIMEMTNFWLKDRAISVH